jgi:hypothetical protein
MGIGTSLFLIAVGAILDLAVKVHATDFNLNTVGLILMLVGVVGLLVSLLFWGSWGGYGFRRSRRVYDERTGTYYEERTGPY